MSEAEVTVDDRGGGEWDAPNQQVVRADQSAPWDEGEGGSETKPASRAASAPGLDGMTKDELLAHAQELGVSPANHSMTKDELRAAIDEHEADS